MPETPVPALAHTVWLGEALSNALDNALRYGGSSIVVRLQALADGALIEIEDDGPGVAPQDLPRLAEPLWRGERADQRSDGGTGLGLAIAYEVVTRLGGQWTAQTRPELDGFRLSWRLRL
jgi:signal transduction histidine kinase